MNVLFVHGMGRSSLSGWPMLRRLRQAGCNTPVFNYLVSAESFRAISARLSEAIASLSSRGPYILIGHSLGGVLVRDALSKLALTAPPPEQVFLLGSPQKASRIAAALAGKRLFRALTGDCGQLLARAALIAEVPPLAAPCTSVIGTRGLRGPIFGDEVNDGIVAESEVAAPWIANTVRVKVVHSMLPASRKVTAVILQKLDALRFAPIKRGARLN